MKWKQLIKDLNLFLFYEPNIELVTSRKILSILYLNMSEIKQNEYLIEFKQLLQTKTKQTSIINYDIKKLRANISKIKGNKINDSKT